MKKAILLFEIGNLNTFNMIFDSAGHTQSSHEHPAHFKQSTLNNIYFFYNTVRVAEGI
jgi:hypothetical protein